MNAWKVGEFTASYDNGKTVLVFVNGPETAEYEQHKSFIRWTYAHDPAAYAELSEVLGGCELPSPASIRLAVERLAAARDTESRMATALHSIRYNAQNGHQDRPQHERLRRIAKTADDAIKQRAGRLAAEPLEPLPLVDEQSSTWSCPRCHASSGEACHINGCYTSDAGEAITDTARIDHLEAKSVRHYGDGHTEPREALISIEWQQSKIGEAFPGVREAIDKEMQRDSGRLPDPVTFTDAEMLDFVLDNKAWVRSFKRDTAPNVYRLLRRDQHETNTWLSGPTALASPREAIAEAMRIATEAKP